MKTYNKILAVLLSGAALVGCNDLDLAPNGSTITEDQKDEILKIDPSKVLASVSGMAGQLTAYGSLTGGSASQYHWDIGFPALFIKTDLRSMDMYSITGGYNWYRDAEQYTDGLASGSTYWFYEYNYNLIRAANEVLKTQLPNINLESPDDNTDMLKFYVAQAAAFRAYGYLYLVQTYQFTYDGHQNDPAVPLITEDNMDQAATDGLPRATVQEIYDQIIKDLTFAIEYLDGNPVTPDKVIESKPKRFVGLGAAYGLRARANLLMCKWAEAAADAQAALDESGATPLSLDEASVPGFNDINAHNWLWGIAVSDNDRVVTSGICNFPSHMGSFASGYATQVGAWKWISKTLYAELPAKDVRKGWWLNEYGESANLSARQLSYVTGRISDDARVPRVQVKFDTYNSVLGQTLNMSDIPLMRAEEMYLIKAEALGMQNLEEGKEYLRNFVRNYRFERYTSTATTTEEFRDAVWFQRRVELWGEGFAYYDMLRLKKDMIRFGGGWPATVSYDIKATDPLLIYPLPQEVITTNPFITEADNTMGGGRPAVNQGDDSVWQEEE